MLYTAVNKSPVLGFAVSWLDDADSWIVSDVSIGRHEEPCVSTPPMHFANVVTVPVRRVPVKSASKGWSLVWSAQRTTSKPLIESESLSATATLSCVPATLELIPDNARDVGHELLPVTVPGSVRHTMPLRL